MYIYFSLIWRVLLLKDLLKQFRLKKNEFILWSSELLMVSQRVWPLSDLDKLNLIWGIGKGGGGGGCAVRSFFKSSEPLHSNFHANIS